MNPKKRSDSDNSLDQTAVTPDVAEFFEKLGLNKPEERQRLLALAQPPADPEIAYWVHLGDTTASPT